MKSPISTYVTFDLETTGLDAAKTAVIEIACCAFNHDLNDVKDFESGIMQVYDNRDITEGALKANGITREQIANGVDPREAIEKLCQYFKHLKVGNSKPVLCGHNIDKFDIPFLDNMFTFFKKDLSDYVNTDFTIDTMWWARCKRAEQVNFKLGTCCEIECIELTDAHRAMTDTRANAALVKTYLRSLKSEGSSVNEEVKYRASFQF